MNLEKVLEIPGKTLKKTIFKDGNDFISERKIG